MSLVDQTALDRLRASLSPSATVNLPGDPGYSVKRWALNAERPAAVVACPATAEDVVQILAFAQGKAPYESQQKLHLAVKCGGHTPSGASSSDGVVIDLNPQMHDVRVDPEAKLAYVGGGCLWENVDEATFKHGKSMIHPNACRLTHCGTGLGLASVSGIVGHTGVGGLTVGGGYGWLCSQHGLVIDNLVQVTVVTSAGEILKASDTENADLFWAVRGGGGNFGVVTEFVIKVHDQRPDLYVLTLMYSPGAIQKVIPEINAWLTERTSAEGAHIVFLMGPMGQPVVVLLLLYNGDPETGAKKFERFTQFGPLVTKPEVIPYLQLNHLKDPLAGHGACRSLQGSFVPDVPSGLPVELIIDTQKAWQQLITNHPAAVRSAVVIELYHNEKWSSVPSDATAFVHRKPNHNVGYVLTWEDPAFTEQAYKANLDLNAHFIKSRNIHFPADATGEGGLTNYMDEESRYATKEFAHRRFGKNFSRLVDIKRKYDPTNMFGRWFTVSNLNEARGEGLH